MVSNTYCVVFLFCFSSSRIPYVASFSDCPFLIAPSIFSNVYIRYISVFVLYIFVFFIIYVKYIFHIILFIGTYSYHKKCFQCTIQRSRHKIVDYNTSGQVYQWGLTIGINTQIKYFNKHKTLQGNI